MSWHTVALRRTAWRSASPVNVAPGQPASASTFDGRPTVAVPDCSLTSSTGLATTCRQRQRRGHLPLTDAGDASERVTRRSSRTWHRRRRLALLYAFPAALGDETVQVCGAYGNNVFARLRSRNHRDRPVPAAVHTTAAVSAVPQWNEPAARPDGGKTTAPAGLELVGAYTQISLSRSWRERWTVAWGGSTGQAAELGPTTRHTAPRDALSGSVELLRDAARLREGHMHPLRATVCGRRSRSTSARPAAPPCRPHGPWQTSGWVEGYVALCFGGLARQACARCPPASTAS